MAIHPRFADAILSGHKKVEFRKRPLASNVNTVVIYATAPVSRVIGEFTVAAIEVAPPSELWLQLRDVGGIDEETFTSYFAGSETGAGIRVAKPRRYASPVALSDVSPPLPVPQSFMYLEPNVAQQLREQAPPGALLLAHRLLAALQAVAGRLIPSRRPSSVLRLPVEANVALDTQPDLAAHG